jgi:iron complex transport system ATP-binding protein
LTGIACSNLSVGYGAKRILSDVELEVRSSEVLALLGPNGGGKSTLLRTLAALIPKLSGSIRVGEEDLSSLSTKEVAKRIGFVPQEEAWSFGFSVAEAVSMGRLPVSNGFFDSDEDREIGRQSMLEAGCYGLRDRPITELSGGERQRVLIARALAQETPVVFLDEPTSHLDPQFQVSTAALVRRLCRKGKAVIVAVHDLAMAAAMADKAALVGGGRVSPIRGTEELLRSAELDAAYGTEFERVQLADGRLISVPKMRHAGANE